MYVDFAKELAWNRAQNPVATKTVTSLHRDSFQAVDFKAKRDLLAPAITHATIERMREFQLSEENNKRRARSATLTKGRSASGRTLSRPGITAGRASKSSKKPGMASDYGGSFRFYSPAEMACARSY